MSGQAQILWRRLDLPGHDACRIWQDGDLRLLEGVAVWQDPQGPAHLAYHVAADSDWITRSVRLQGRVGARDLTMSIHRNESGEWRLNGEALPDFTGLQDIDLGFTPATNTLPIRRLRQTRQDEASIAAVWLDTSDWALKRLPQTYRRTDAGWHYASPGFAADLTVDADGFVTHYPDLWTKED
ncbi:putative glycolipid-binding domain-containing protein [Paracoccus xiamenensis]|uniref:putative glycolipid-binding domain-containing protein n=1 Tax=Paracoccus xiamenensis TaxID=2714901 RepID=UPI00140D71F6|nr:putative glycolipid-binding domain-containing protein [Paracoccus xiamenensis]NHF72809.1 putative glycolipid-binding domain-containing protein [Paracoccus xiamenensis]